MDLIRIFLWKGLLCTGFGIGLTIIRDIDPKTLKHVFIASYLCGGFNFALYSILNNYFLCALISCFIATVYLKIMCIKGKCPVYFPIVITSVYCICPGTAMGNMFHHAFSLNIEKFLPLFVKSFWMCAGIVAGVLLADKVIKSEKFRI